MRLSNRERLIGYRHRINGQRLEKNLGRSLKAELSHLHAVQVQLLRFDHAIVEKESGPCLTISFYVGRHNMTYLKPQFTPLNDDITQFTSVDLNSR